MRTGSKDSRKKHQLQISADGRSKMMLVTENNSKGRSNSKSRNAQKKNDTKNQFITLTN